MAEHFSFFDAVETSPNVYDREYNAQQFTEYFNGLVETGVMRGELNEFLLSNTGANMITTMDSGVAYVEGRYYHNDAPLALQHDTESIGLNRIDRIVIRLDLKTNARYVKAFIKKGVAATNPIAPTLQRDDMIYELSIGQVYIVGGQTFIATNAITYEVGNRTLCPFATSKILPYIDESLELVKFKTDYGYQDATVSGDTIIINRASDTSRLQFKLREIVLGNPLRISSDSGVTSSPLLNFDETNVQRLDPGFIEIYEDGTNFYYVRKGGEVIADFDGFSLLQEYTNAANNISDFTKDDAYFYVTTGASTLEKVDIKTLKKLSEVSLTDTATKIVCVGDFLYLWDFDTTPKLIKKRKSDLVTVSTRALTSATSYGRNGLLAYNDRLFSVDFLNTQIRFSEINKNTLATIRTCAESLSTSTNYSNLVILKDTVYGLNNNNHLFAIDINTMVTKNTNNASTLQTRLTTNGQKLFALMTSVVRDFALDLSNYTQKIISDNNILTDNYDSSFAFYFDGRIIRQRSNNVSPYQRVISRLNLSTSTADFVGPVINSDDAITKAIPHKNILLILKGSKIVKLFNQNG